MDKRIHPDPYQTREKINEMPCDTDEDLIYKNGFKYLYLIAGRISELVGKYAPISTDPYYKIIQNEEAVIFPVKTARRKGGYRPVILPFARKYEEWTEKLYEWFQNRGSKNPFDLGKITKAKIQYYPRYYQWKAEDVFEDHKWYREKYIIEGETEPAEEKPFTLMRLRDQRIRELRDNFDFYDEEIRVYTGLYQPRFSRMSRLLTPSPNEPLSKPNYPELEKGGIRYFPKLLRTRS